MVVVWQILIDTIDALAEAPQEVVQRPEGSNEANTADVCTVALYMFAQLYIRQAQRADAMDVWPSSSLQAAAAALTVSTAWVKDTGRQETAILPQSLWCTKASRPARLKWRLGQDAFLGRQEGQGGPALTIQ